MHNSTGYVIKQLVHAFSCAPSSYGALGKFGTFAVKLLQIVVSDVSFKKVPVRILLIELKFMTSQLHRGSSANQKQM